MLSSLCIRWFTLEVVCVTSAHVYQPKQAMCQQGGMDVWPSSGENRE